MHDSHAGHIALGRRDPSQKTLAICVSVIVVACFSLSWIGSAPSHVTGLQWDTSTYLLRFGPPGHRWARIASPWTSHLALPQLYILACNVAQLFGANALTGFRLLQALCLSGAGVLVFAIARRLSRDNLVAVAVALAFATAWGTLNFVFGMVDDILYLPPALGVVLVSVSRVDQWRDRDSALAGLLAGVAMLLSLQCILYVLPPLFALFPLARQDWKLSRLRHYALYLAVLCATLALWGVVLGLTTPAGVSRVFDFMLARPQASFLPKDATGLPNLLSPALFVKHLGMGIAQQLVPVGDSEALYRRMPNVAVWVMAVELVLWVGVVIAYYLKRADKRAVLVASMLLAFTAAASLYHDLLTDKYKRYGFLPLLILLVIASLIGNAQRHHRRLAQAGALALTLVTAIQMAHAVSINLRWHREQPNFPRALNIYYGRDHVSWIGYFERLRRQNPDVCRFLFDVVELRAMRYNHEIGAGLEVELPSYGLIGTVQDVYNWKVRPSLIDPAAPNSWSPCVWASPSARVRLRM